MAFEDAGRLMIRGALASVFGYAALKHARSKKGTSSWLASVGYRDPDLSWAAMTASESAAALSMVLGAGTSLGASAVNGAMTSAVMTVHRQNGWPEENGGVEWPVTLMVVASALAALGPGRYSLDRALGLDEKLDGGSGLGLAVMGVAAGLAQVATMWKAPVAASAAS